MPENTPEKNQEKTIALLVAAGKSERMPSDIPKPYLSIGQNTILRQSVKTFMTHPGIDGVRVVIRRDHHPMYKQAIAGLSLFPCVIGGENRQESVLRGLESIAHRKPERVLVHDAARPGASHALISRVLESLENHKAVIPTLKVADTVKRIRGGRVSETIEREDLYTVQTPQGFHFRDLLEAHRRFAGVALTDDAAVMERAGIAVAMVEGDTDNFKITTGEDLRRMQAQLVHNTETRVGTGYDVHALQAHDSDTPAVKHTITLCGVRIPHTHRLVGHSDADVGMHALVDAILGALGAGDIGTHFPPSDAQWRGADSSRFLLYAYELVANRGGSIAHLDITLICEQPKIAPHREEMIRRLAQILKLSPDRVSIKATTTEKLGFTGRSEGIAAQAVATLQLPRSAA
jgi:2-C-methyl-D-erythritol 4-phosphate cytidylyltransferase/2-C-methyl-D-erythritol 2,4-cyclodiphosphate synthase